MTLSPASFGPFEQAKMLLVRPDVTATTLRIMQRAQDATGLKWYVIRGYSSLSEQQATYADSVAEGYRAAPANLSKHPRGAAVDLGCEGHVHDDASIDQADPVYKVMADIAVDEGMIAGFYFSGGLPDPYHIEANEALSVSDAKWATLTSGRLWRALGVGAGVGILGWLLYRAHKSRRKR